VSVRSVPPGFIPPKKFVPPRRFKVLDPTVPRPSVFPNTSADFRGKELWHIIAPSSVPIESLKELDMEDLNGKKPLLSHKGLDYALKARPLSKRSVEMLLLPRKKQNVYHTVSKPVGRVLDLRQLVDLPRELANAGNAPSMTQRVKKQPRKSPGGLRMRHRAVGVDNGPPAVMGSSSESEVDEPSFKVPQGSNLEKKAKKRKRTEADESPQSHRREARTNGAELPHKKSKKVHQSHDDGKAKSQVKDTKSLLQSGSKSRNKEELAGSKKSREESDKPTEETNHERKARKEEKKRKKLEKEEKKRKKQLKKERK
jgi:hypothetical protein